VRRWSASLLGLRVRRNILGFLGFVLTYQMLMSPIAVVGYGQELLGLRRRWNSPLPSDLNLKVTENPPRSRHQVARSRSKNER